MKKQKQDISSAIDFLKKNIFFEKQEKLQKQSALEGFWDNPTEAQKVSSQLSQINKLINTWKNLEESYATLEELQAELSEEEFLKEKETLEKEIQKAKIELFLSGEFDQHNAIVTLSVGAGGVDANDWTQMVFEMLIKYCEKKGWKTQILDVQEADSVGIKSAVFRVFGGENIFGFLKSENGSHRLIRPSPFNAKNTRETSFCNVEVVAEIESNEAVQIDEKDLKIDTFRAQGAGGQHVNTTDSAVRITHIPTGIVAQCQNQRSQLQNKSSAMKVLESRVAEKQRQEKEIQQASFKNEKVQASFGGGHIRSYVLDDRYVKDQRTGLKSSQVEKILNGDLDEFIEAFVVMQ